MPGFLLPLIIAGVSAASTYFGNRKGARTSTSEGESTSTRTGTSTRTPVTTPEFDELSSTLIDKLLADIEDPEDLKGIMAEIGNLKSAGLEQVNLLAERISKQIQNKSRAQGLGFSSSANFGEAVAGQARTGALSSFLSEMAKLKIKTGLQVPQILADIRAQEARSGTDLLRSLPLGEETNFEDTTRTVSSGTQVAPGSVAGALFNKAGDFISQTPEIRAAFGNPQQTPNVPRVTQQPPLTQPGVDLNVLRPRFDPFDPDLD